MGEALPPRTSARHIEDDELTKSYPALARREYASLKPVYWFALGVMFGMAFALFIMAFTHHRSMQFAQASLVQSLPPEQIPSTEPTPTVIEPPVDVAPVATAVDDAARAAAAVEVVSPQKATPHVSTPRHRVASKPKAPRPIILSGASGAERTR